MKDAAEPLTPAVLPQGSAVAVAPDEEATAMRGLLTLAVEKGVPVETLERLQGMYDRQADRRAAREFAEALAAFKAECPPIPRRTENSQFTVTRNGTKAPRRYASLEDIEKTVRGPLGAHGLSFRWSDTKVEGGNMTMTCVVTHLGGHAESASVVLPVDSKAGCSEQQKYGSAMTYAQRYSLIQALGLTTCDEDDDGNGPPAGGITESQAADLRALLSEKGIPEADFLRKGGYATVEAIPADRYPGIVRAIQQRAGR